MTTMEIERAITIASTLPDKRCKEAWDFLDAMAPGDFMSSINELAQISDCTEFITLVVSPLFDKILAPCPDHLKPGALLCLISAFEHAARSNRL